MRSRDNTGNRMAAMKRTTNDSKKTVRFSDNPSSSNPTNDEDDSEDDPQANFDKMLKKSQSTGF